MNEKINNLIWQLFRFPFYKCGIRSIHRAFDFILQSVTILLLLPCWMGTLIYEYIGQRMILHATQPSLLCKHIYTLITPKKESYK